jgi:hypothetical protein
MVRRVAVLGGSVVFAVSTVLLGQATSAVADTGSQSVRTESGKVRCYINANDQSHGGLGPDVVANISKAFRMHPSTTTDSIGT